MFFSMNAYRNGKDVWPNSRPTVNIWYINGTFVRHQSRTKWCDVNSGRVYSVLSVPGSLAQIEARPGTCYAEWAVDRRRRGRVLERVAHATGPAFDRRRWKWCVGLDRWDWYVLFEFNSTFIGPTENLWIPSLNSQWLYPDSIGAIRWE